MPGKVSTLRCHKSTYRDSPPLVTQVLPSMLHESPPAFLTGGTTPAKRHRGRATSSCCARGSPEEVVKEAMTRAVLLEGRHAELAACKH
jgi:hypothetical protein